MSPSPTNIPFPLADRVPGGSAYGVPTPQPQPPGTDKPQLLRLNSNEGPQPTAWLSTRLAQAGPQAFQRYPDPMPLTQCIAAREGVDATELLVTAGGDEALERLCKLVLQPGRNAVLPVPTFEMIERYSALAQGSLREVQWTAGDLPANDILAAIDGDTSAVFVVSPNNPTGLVASPDAVRRLAVAAPDVLLVLDLAYAEFAEDNLVDLAHTLPNAVAVRSLSKAWGLAGLRVGWAAGPASIIQRLRALGGPYSVPAPSLFLAEQWLAEGQSTVETYVQNVACERRDLRAHILALGGDAQPSQGNFVLARFATAERAQAIHAALESLGVLTRCWPTRPGLENAIRITCPGDREDFARLMQSLSQAMDPQSAEQPS